MPERQPTAKPTIVAGTTFVSGDPNTGQQLFSQGGTKTFTKFSGTAGGDANVWVGAGRLDNACLFDGSVVALSGTPVIFYDSAIAVSGGPIAASGHKVVGVLGVGGSTKGVAASGDVFMAGLSQTIAMPFNSGLCYTSRSGHLGFSISYTPVVSGTQNG